MLRRIRSLMTDLSPAALAVLDAFGTYPLRADHIDEDLVPALAAALRAAADQVVPDDHEYMRDAIPDAYDRQQFIREDLLAIAAELDGATTTSEND
jgi:hypothetical protein